MLTISEDRKIADLTVGEFRNLVKETFYEIVDPDQGLELRPEVEEDLKISLRSETRIPVEEVAKKIGA
ncbi:hypothetical protein QUF72_16050 [Desulfobacterales bacterium HSG2]|nr:hypothetical protein [Desulfobacterales bacterium HSG2]